jgi:hypothetical protein
MKGEPMERDEIIKGLYQIKNWKCNGDAEMHEVIESAIKFLEQTNTTSDTISRMVVIDAVHKNYDTILDFKSNGRTVADSFEDIINALPSAEPERKKGKWIPHEDEDGEHYGDKCSVCGEWYVMPCGKANFCPNCGADMRGGQDGDTRSNQAH